jgi:vacuolar-type H+-ATPase subunit C/Vma6
MTSSWAYHQEGKDKRHLHNEIMYATEKFMVENDKKVLKSVYSSMFQSVHRVLWLNAMFDVLAGMSGDLNYDQSKFWCLSTDNQQ